MSKDLDKLLDECIDRMNEGESLEKCLASYPDYADQLEPLLRAVWDFRDTCSIMPRAAAKSVVRRRLDAALVNSERSLRKVQRQPRSLFGWSRVWATVAIVLVVALIGFGLNWILAPGVAPVLAQANFRLLLSDDENAIGDFQSLEVTITSIGMLPGGEWDKWEVIELKPSVVVDLTHLQGLNAQGIWSGKLPEGQYTKVFIYVENVIGMLKTVNGDLVMVFLPSGKLQISKPFAITTDDPVVNFVYDVTVIEVIEAGKSGKYILTPQVTQSGPHQSFNEVLPGKVEIEGLIQGFNLPDFDQDPDAQGQIEILGLDLVVTIDKNTEIEGIEEGGGVVGLMAEVEAVAVVQSDDGYSFLATEIEVEEEEEASATKVEIEGLIEASELVDGEGWIEILGLEVVIDGNTEIEGIEGTLDDGVVGRMAEVEAVVQPDTDGSRLLAIEIEVEDEEESSAMEVEIEGLIQGFNLPDFDQDPDAQGSIEILTDLGQVVAIDINRDTEIEGIEGISYPYDEVVGRMAEVEAVAVVQPGDGYSLLATEIEVEGGELTLEVDEGALEQQLSLVFARINAELSLPLAGFNIVSANLDVDGDTLTYTVRAVKGEVLELPPLLSQLLQEAGGWQSFDITLSDDSLDITFEKDYSPVIIDSRTYVPSASVTISVTAHEDDGITEINYDVDITLEET